LTPEAALKAYTRQAGFADPTAPLSMIARGLKSEVAMPSPAPVYEPMAQSSEHQYRAFPGVRGNGIASRTLARPVTQARPGKSRDEPKSAM